MSRRVIELRLSRRDVLCTHGLLNASAACLGLGLLVLAGWVFITVPPKAWTWEVGAVPVIAVLLLLTEQGVLRSMWALVSRRPYLTVSDSGIAIDGGPFERWAFRWDEVTQFAPHPRHIVRLARSTEETGEGFVWLEFRAPSRSRRRPFSEIQHVKFRDIYQVSGHFEALGEEEAGQLVALVVRHVGDIQPFLLSDIPD